MSSRLMFYDPRSVYLWFELLSSLASYFSINPSTSNVTKKNISQSRKVTLHWSIIRWLLPARLNSRVDERKGEKREEKVKHKPTKEGPENYSRHIREFLAHLSHTSRKRLTKKKKRENQHFLNRIKQYWFKNNNNNNNSQKHSPKGIMKFHNWKRAPSSSLSLSTGSHFYNTHLATEERNWGCYWRFVSKGVLKGTRREPDSVGPRTGQFEMLVSRSHDACIGLPKIFSLDRGQRRLSELRLALATRLLKYLEFASSRNSRVKVKLTGYSFFPLDGPHATSSLRDHRVTRLVMGPHLLLGPAIFFPESVQWGESRGPITGADLSCSHINSQTKATAILSTDYMARVLNSKNNAASRFGNGKKKKNTHFRVTQLKINNHTIRGSQFLMLMAKLYRFSNGHTTADCLNYLYSFFWCPIPGRRCVVWYHNYSQEMSHYRDILSWQLVDAEVTELQLQPAIKRRVLCNL